MGLSNELKQNLHVIQETDEFEEIELDLDKKEEKKIPLRIKDSFFGSELDEEYNQATNEDLCDLQSLEAVFTK